MDQLSVTGDGPPCLQGASPLIMLGFNQTSISVPMGTSIGTWLAITPWCGPISFSLQEVHHANLEAGTHFSKRNAMVEE
jgi:hypothetical protein